MLAAEWSDYVMDYATKRLGMDMSAYTHKIFVLMAGRDASQGPTCPWGGLGYTGCTQNDCRVWINGEVWQVSIAACPGCLPASAATCRHSHGTHASSA